MPAETASAAGKIMAAIASLFIGTITAVVESYPTAIRIIWIAPIIFLIAAIPEFMQHVAEIKMGMFSSIEQAKIVANSPERWAFGYAKIAGLVIALLLTTRFLGLGQSMRKAIRPTPYWLGRTVILIAGMLGFGYGLEWLSSQTETNGVKLLLDAVSWIIQFGFILLIAAALVEDRDMTVRKAFGLYLPSSLLIGVCFFAVMLPLQFVHSYNHKFAMGQPGIIVWALMIWDSLLVGLMATGMGAAIWTGYHSGASWRGWQPRA